MVRAGFDDRGCADPGRIEHRAGGGGGSGVATGSSAGENREGRRGGDGADRSDRVDCDWCADFWIALVASALSRETAILRKRPEPALHAGQVVVVVVQTHNDPRGST